jgi:hypothetical protein
VGTAQLICLFFGSFDVAAPITEALRGQTISFHDFQR